MASTHPETDEKTVQTTVEAAVRQAAPVETPTQSEEASAASDSLDADDFDDVDVEELLIASGMQPRGAQTKPTSVKGAATQRPVSK